MKTLRLYLALAKPGIIMGNAITAVAGFALASKDHFSFSLFLAMLFGISSVIGAACVFNNYIDRAADKKMARTKSRPLAQETIPTSHAIVYAAILGTLGLTLLGTTTNLTTLLVALTGLVVYVLWYSFWKYRTVHATLIGSIAGAVPIVVGYTAANGTLDTGAYILFAMLVLWQMPHFFAIAIYRIDDYALASIPVLPIKRGLLATKIQMLLYIVAFTVSAILPTVYGYTGSLYFFAALILGLLWTALGIQGFKASNDKRWAYQMFRFSLVTITLLSALLSFSAITH